jgi:hypothetical protein
VRNVFAVAWPAATRSGSAPPLKLTWPSLQAATSYNVRLRLR